MDQEPAVSPPVDAPALLQAWRGDRSRVLVAREFDCDPSHIARIENRQAIPKDYRLRKLFFDVCGIPMDAWDLVEIQPRLRRGRSRVNDTGQGASPPGDSQDSDTRAATGTES